jgi:hypothetical protein
MDIIGALAVIILLSIALANGGAEALGEIATGLAGLALILLGLLAGFMLARMFGPLALLATLFGGLGMLIAGSVIIDRHKRRQAEP